MPRRKRHRMIGGIPMWRRFVPVGVPGQVTGQVMLALDEFEALRLVDYEGLDQETAAGRMGVSRPVLSRILKNARYKVASALVEGAEIVVEGGPVQFAQNFYRCVRCFTLIPRAPGEPPPTVCPNCGGTQFELLNVRFGPHGRGRGGHWR